MYDSIHLTCAGNRIVTFSAKEDRPTLIQISRTCSSAFCSADVHQICYPNHCTKPNEFYKMEPQAFETIVRPSLRQKLMRQEMNHLLECVITLKHPCNASLKCTFPLRKQQQQWERGRRRRRQQRRCCCFPNSRDKVFALISAKDPYSLAHKDLPPNDPPSPRHARRRIFIHGIHLPPPPQGMEGFFSPKASHQDPASLGAVSLKYPSETGIPTAGLWTRG